MTGRSAVKQQPPVGSRARLKTQSLWQTNRLGLSERAPRGWLSRCVVRAVVQAQQDSRLSVYPRGQLGRQMKEKKVSEGIGAGHRRPIVAAALKHPWPLFPGSLFPRCGRVRAALVFATYALPASAKERANGATSGGGGRYDGDSLRGATALQTFCTASRKLQVWIVPFEKLQTVKR